MKKQKNDMCAEVIKRQDEEIAKKDAEIKRLRAEGEWETIPDCQPNRLLSYRHACSVCGNVYKDLNCHGHNYCHWCGAKMKGE